MAKSGQLSADFTVPNWVKFTLIIVAAFQSLGSLQMVPLLFLDDPAPLGNTPKDLLIKSVIVLSPIVAIAGLAFAIKGQIARAVMAIAGVSTLDWIGYIPSFAVDPSGLWDFPGPFLFFVVPACAPIALVLAWLRKWPRLAIVLALTPWAVRAIMVAVFAGSVAIYGF